MVLISVKILLSVTHTEAQFVTIVSRPFKSFFHSPECPTNTGLSSLVCELEKSLI